MNVGDSRPQVSIDSVVFATDFSTCSEKAGQYARLLARYYSAGLIVAHAFQASQAAMEAESFSHNFSRQRKDLLSRLTSIVKAPGEGVEAEAVLLEGNTETAIAALAEKHAPALIVLGTHGPGRVQREFLGSAAERILRSTPWPCLVVGPRVPNASEHAVPFRRILYATDFTPAAARAAIYAISLAKDAGADIDVLNVVPVKTVDHPDRLSELREHFYDELDRLVPGQAREFCNPRSFVETGNAHQQIQEHIRQHDIDLLVIGVRKSSHLDLEIRMSNAFRLVIESPCPVLTIRS